MKSSRTFLGSFLLIFMLMPGVSAAFQYGKAAPEREAYRYEFRQAQQKNNGISRDQAAAIVKRRYGGKILAVSEVRKKGQVAYRIKGLSDKSQVYVVFVDKKSGRVSR